MSTVLTVLSLIGFIALTAGTALFVAAEFSLTALERSTVEAHAREGDVRARMVRQAHRTLSFQLSGAQLGITITTLITGYIAEPVLARLLRPVFTAVGLGERAAGGISLALALVLATSLSMIYGELVPKNIAIAKPLATARATAGPMVGFSVVFKWMIHFLNGTANWVVRRLGVEPAEELRSARSPQELGSLVRTSAQRGALDQRTAQVMDRSLQFGERSAEELMTPRVKVESLDKDDTIADLLAAAGRTGYSRFPVIDGDLDNTLGVVHIKQAFTQPAAQRRTIPLRLLARPVPVVPASLDGDELLERVRAHGMQVALVVDEYGGTAGLVSMEDLIEEILGDVRDEHDEEERDVRRTADGWDCSGLLRIDEVSRATGYEAPEGEYETLGGLVLTRLGRIPEVGDEVMLPNSPAHHRHPYETEQGGWIARVERMDGRRIDRVRLIPVTAEELVSRTLQEHSHG
ncbi:HlyC/CorC family transporter [Nocardia farcinica]|uniref:hemolysin family protein n=1 Tax=Nocardia farcinica TaxID=37329 RepID=UPI001895B8DB|nr:hemolysin family protein [Nocardia farcinica]MBF6249738.1 HlyC/CorC family transporter [Nocardia farcinica]MBF6261058.1 HlyC/CorC family transporter [Nocardia farcinica]MBF6267430.1 HlyC/CorC family transporter [Nocardia farcinica]MBF6279274.1 HlyC/CorC family transporter [Nocardia farcinica]MBF6304068.1 HlyC/CorC family transporter [Nocardia farcinica]